MFKHELNKVPNKPGSYQMYNKKDHVIYVGKAKDLKNRLSSYFNNNKHTGKTRKMISEISYFKYIITDSEFESFILEINLIKKFKPKYNILLRDDKTYPYIEYTHHPHPELKLIRFTKRKADPNKILFGPYVNVYAARRVVKLLNRLYPLKKCKSNAKEPCFYYHIDECLGYCFKEVEQEKIDVINKEVLEFFKGNSKNIKDKIHEKIELHSNNLNYEMAAELKEELDFINIILEQQKVEMLNDENLDVINYHIDESIVSLVILFIRDGKLLGSNEEIFNYSSKDELEAYIGMFYERREVPDEIIIPNDINNELLSKVHLANFKHISRGKKRKLLNLASKNAKAYFDANKNKFIRREERTTLANDKLSKLLNIDIKTIEAFDNSHLFGNDSVSGMVVFIDGKENRNAYRKYKIKQNTNDDYEMLREVLRRRYTRVINEGVDFPDLIIVDGGVGHVRAALRELNKLDLSVKLIGLKKDDNHITESIIDDNFNEIYIKDDKVVYNYLKKIQDEVHRYTISYHQNVRSKSLIHTTLNDVSGLGPKRIMTLLKKYGSINNIKKASVEELNEILPKQVAIDLKEKLENE